MKNSSCSYLIPQKNQYSLGVELEFFIRDRHGNRRYLSDLLNSFGESNIDKLKTQELVDILYDDYDDEWMDYILGFDGSGINTPEFRSPVFCSENMNSVFDSFLDFSEEVQRDLTKDYKARFRPYYRRAAYGLHFSLGGRFLEDEINRIVLNCAKLQPELIKLVPDSVIDDFNNREISYPGQLPNLDGVDIKSPSYNAVDQISYSNGIRFHPDVFHPERVEFRFFPSCFITSLEECFRFILFDSRFPTKKLKFSRN